MPHERRVFFESDSADPGIGSHLSLSKEDSHHLTKVLRLKEGAMVVAVSKKTAVTYEAVLSKAQEIVEIRLISKRSNAHALGSNLTSRVERVYMALLKGPHLQTFLEQVSELGVPEIVIWAAERSVAKIAPRESAEKVARWQRIAESAAKQSGQVVVPKISFFPSLELALADRSESRQHRVCLVCSLAAGAKELRQIEISPNTRFQFIIGPEGDFTASEEALVFQAGFLPVTLGPLRLRSEMAGLTAVVSTHALFGYI